MADTDQQVTSKTPGTKQKNPKRVAAGKAVAERTRIAREEQRKALIKAQSMIAQAKPPASQADPVADTPPASQADPVAGTPSASQADPVAGTPSASQADPVADTPSAETTKNVLTTTQWLSIISIVVSVAGLYYKREEIKNLLVKKADSQPRAPPPSPVLTRAPPVIREMD